MESTDLEFVCWCQVVYLVSYSCLKSINGREIQAGWVVPELFSQQLCILLGRKAETQVMRVGALLGAEVPCPSPHVTTQKETHNIFSMLNSVAKNHKLFSHPINWLKRSKF